jgi:4-hydroxybenzoyl-CoA thioesterase
VTLFERPVRFEDVDAAGIVFFGRFFSYCHEAMESFFDPVAGGYVGLITKARRGFPAVHVDCDFSAPLRYGDVVAIETTVGHVGTTSCTFEYVLKRKADGVVAARVKHVCVHTDLTTMTKVPFAPELRALLASHARTPS